MIMSARNLTSAFEISIYMLCKVCFTPIMLTLYYVWYLMVLNYAGTLTSSIRLVEYNRLQIV